MPSIINATTTNGLSTSADNSGSLQLATNNGTTAVTIDTSQNVGIGTTSPADRLHIVTNGTSVYNVFRASNANSTATMVVGVAGSAVAATTLQNNAYLWNIGNSALSFGTNDTERMRIDSSGNLLVGATSGSIHRLLKNNAGASVAEVFNTSTTAGTRALEVGMNTNGDATGTFIRCGDQGAFRFQVLGNGNAQNVNNSYGSISDIKLKENIVDATPKLEKLKQVRVVNYNLKNDTTKQIGVIAQELEQVFPSMVDEMPDRDKEGNDLGTTTKSVKYSVFVPMLIKAIQELNAKVEAQAVRIAELEGAK